MRYLFNYCDHKKHSFQSKSKMHQSRNRLAAGLHPDPLGELERSPRPHSRIRGLGPPGMEGEEGRGREGGEVKERGGERERREERGGERKGGERDLAPRKKSWRRHWR